MISRENNTVVGCSITLVIGHSSMLVGSHFVVLLSRCSILCAGGRRIVLNAGRSVIVIAGHSIMNYSGCPIVIVVGRSIVIVVSRSIMNDTGHSIIKESGRTAVLTDGRFTVCAADWSILLDICRTTVLVVKNCTGYSGSWLIALVVSHWSFIDVLPLCYRCSGLFHYILAVDCSVLIQWSDILYSQSSTVIASFHQPTFLIAQPPVPLLYIPLHAPSTYTCIPSYCQVGIVSVACGIILYVVIAFIAQVN